MKLDLHNQFGSRLPSDLEISEAWIPGPNGQPCVQLSIDSHPNCIDSGDTVWLYRADALEIVKHLTRVFNLTQSEREA